MKRDIEFFTIMTSFMQSVRYSIHNPYGQVRNNLRRKPVRLLAF